MNTYRSLPRVVLGSNWDLNDTVARSKIQTKLRWINGDTSIPVIHPALIGATMARREYQDPSILTRVGARGPEYYLRYRTKVLEMKDGQPRLVRRQKWQFLGLCSEMTVRQAERAKAKIMAEINGQVYTVQSQVPFEELVKVYRQAHLSKLAVPTQHTYDQWLRKYIEPALAGRRLCEIKRHELQTLIAGLPLAGTTKASVRGVLASVWTYAKEWGYWEGDNPVPKGGWGGKAGKYKYEKTLLTPEQLRLLLLAVNADVRLIIKTLVSTGMRISECLGLRWKAVDLDAGLITVSERQCRGDIGAPKSSAGARVLPLGVLVDEYRERRDASRLFPPDSFVFHTPDGEGYRDNELLANYLTPIMRRLGMKRPGMGWHMFRRMHLTYFSRTGATDFEVMHQAGHSSLAVTKDYVLGDVARRAEGVVKVQAVLLPAQFPVRSGSSV